MNGSSTRNARAAGWLALLVAAVMVFALGSAPAWGATSATTSTEADSAGNVFMASEGQGWDVEPISVDSAGDFVWFGASADLSNATIAGDVIAAGRTFSTNGVSVAGNIRAAGQDIALTNVQVERNVTAAGATVSFGADSSARGVYLAGERVTFLGEAQAVALSGNTVVVNGTVNGDASVWANNVVVGADARITGTLHVLSDTQPQVATTAQVGSMDVTITAAADVETDTDVAVSAAASWGSRAVSVAGAVAVALLLALVLPGATCGSAQMLRRRPVALLVSGLIAAIVALPVVILLFVLLLTIGLGAALIGALVALTTVAVPLTGAAVCGAIFPKWNRFGAAALGGLVWGALTLVPILGVVVSVFSFIFAIGFAVQAVWLGILRWKGARAGGQKPLDNGEAAVCDDAAQLPDAMQGAAGEAPVPPAGA